MASKGEKRIPFNYYRSGSPRTSTSPFVKKTPKTTDRARKFLIRALDILIIIIILFGLVYSLLVKASPRIILNDSTYHSIAEYRTAATKFFGAFKNHNKITLDEQGVVAALQKQFPEIANASVELPLFSQTPIVHLVIAKPSFFLTSRGTDYVINSQGVATSEAKNAPQIKNLTTLIDQSGFTTVVGKQVLSAENVGFIKSVLQQAVRAKVPIKALILPARAQELDLQTTDHGYFVKFYLGGDANLQSGQFLAARHRFDKTRQQPSQYLDVRVPGKIFYK